MPSPKTLLLILSVLTLILPTPSIAATSTTQTPPATSAVTGNIKDVTVKETLRYALELYRTDNYPEAVKAFQSVLAKDCTDRLAQYHLQKIAQAVPEFASLKDYLKNLPCKKYDFNEDDFLPAASYFEKDPALMLEQLEAYNKRYRDSKITLSSQINEYKDLAQKLEARVQEMTDMLAENNKMSADAVSRLETSLSQAKKDAEAMSGQVAELKKAQTKTPDIVKKSDAASPLPDNNTNAGSTAFGELSGLQAKFSNIQQRLNQIERSIAQKNQRVTDLQDNLEAVKQ